MKNITSGDRVTFDFAGYLDGKAFDGGRAKDYTLVIGSGQFIPGFEEGMIGLTIGDTKNIKLPFPEDYHAKELVGQDVVFKVKIISIKKN
ncbi:FKBP-type peptidyl-prolyl cis-trans isomerase [Candidatus Mycoplasma mahonii]|uniref:FKBP-type peptidyl-prolyl cis-trans isomerase n=1 Tax=Candidatus Mycoplasma mahonii TaxID=3004105 RepID=UPI0026F344A9|nr:FKBP-type peptidyl-prolyl cis-trans isomerase [Candidatus Mycoplasma mahonii]WKX02561.1 FKBP-type peptidyl-prolyl cis-trans isomerase [Candidatus Mycoplasma mahonii]